MAGNSTFLSNINEIKIQKLRALSSFSAPRIQIIKVERYLCKIPIESTDKSRSVDTFLSPSSSHDGLNLMFTYQEVLKMKAFSHNIIIQFR